MRSKPSSTAVQQSLWHRPPQGWSHTLPGLLSRLRQNELTMLAAAVSFYGILALVPALFALWSLVGLYLEPHAAESALRSLLPDIPERSNQMLLRQLKEIASHPPGSLNTGLWLSLLATLWAASSGMDGLLRGLRSAAGLRPATFLKQRAMALGLTLGALGFVAFLLLVIVATPLVLQAAGLEVWVPVYDRYARWPLLLAAWLTGVEFLYHAAAQPARAPKFLFTPGSAVGVAAALFGTVGFSFYADRWGRWEATYGALAGVVVLLLWLYGVALALLFGATLNAHLAQAQANSGQSA